MCYVCGKSRKKIIHSMDCRYVRMIPKKNQKRFETINEAIEDGYVMCKYCGTYMMKYINREKKQLERYCKANSMAYYYDSHNGALDVISRSGKWKIIVNGRNHQIWLYHKNTYGSISKSMIPGYHSQNVRCDSLMGYMNYIVEHDLYRDANPLYEHQKHPNSPVGSKKWKNDQRRAKEMRRRMSINYVLNMLNTMAAGNIAY